MDKESKLNTIAKAVALASLLFTNIPATRQLDRPPAQKERKQIRELNEQESKIVEKVTGIPYAELRQAYDLEVPINLGADANYAVHAGQNHQAWEGIDTQESLEVTKKNQKAIFDLIERLTVSGTKKEQFNCVYLEGRDFEGVRGMAAARKEFWELHQEIYTFIENVRTQDFSKIQAEDVTADVEYLRSLAAYAEDLDKYSLYGERILTAFKLYREKMASVTYAHPHVVERFIDAENIVAALEKKWGKPSIYAYGGAEAAYYKNNFPLICVGEHALLNKDAVEGSVTYTAIQASKKLDALNSELKEKLEELLSYLRGGGKDAERIKQSENEIDALKREHNAQRVLFRDLTKRALEELNDPNSPSNILREDYIVAQLPGDRNSLVVLGEKHELTRAIKDRNSVGPTHKSDAEPGPLGLIKITPKE